MNLCKARMSETYILAARVIQGEESENLRNECSVLKVVAEDVESTRQGWIFKDIRVT